jgi:hypothetical protein
VGAAGINRIKRGARLDSPEKLPGADCGGGITAFSSQELDGGGASVHDMHRLSFSQARAHALGVPAAIVKKTPPGLA